MSVVELLYSIRNDPETGVGLKLETSQYNSIELVVENVPRSVHTQKLPAQS